MNQKEKMLSFFDEIEWIPVQFFLQNYIPRYGANIYSLKKEGYIFEKRRQEKNRRLEEWKLISKPLLCKKK